MIKNIFKFIYNFVYAILRKVMYYYYVVVLWLKYILFRYNKDKYNALKFIAKIVYDEELSFRIRY